MYALRLGDSFMLPPDISILTPEERASIPDILQLMPEEIELLDNRTRTLAIALGVHRVMTKLIAEGRDAHKFGQLQDANKDLAWYHDPHSDSEGQPLRNFEFQGRLTVEE
jgi:hypothetical protein